MMLGKGGIKGSRDGNVVGSALLVLLMNGLLMKLRMVHGVGGVNTGRRCRDRRSCHGRRGLHLGLNSRGQPSGETIPSCHEQLGIPAFALGDRVGPIGKRGFLVVLLLLLLLLHFQLLQMLLPGEELGVPALAVGDGLALGDLSPQDGLELRSALLDAKELTLNEADATTLGKMGEARGSGRLSCRKVRRGRTGEIDGSSSGHIWLVGTSRRGLGLSRWSLGLSSLGVLLP